MATSRFSDVKLAPAIEVFALTDTYKQDTDPNKVNLGVGAYRTDAGVPWVLPVVCTVEKQMAADPTLNHEYLPVAGLPAYREAGSTLLLGSDSPAVLQKRVDAIQALGGTGAIFLGMNFLRTRLGASVAYVSKPTWGNHKGIASNLGYEVREYRYWDEENRCLNIDGFLEDLKAAPENAVILLHACAHNPTGVDPTVEQWNQIIAVCKERSLFPFLDCAYQGFSSGDLEKDAMAVRLFVKSNFEIFAAQSFSKNFGLYNERVGLLTFVSNTAENLAQVSSQLQTIVRQTWSNSPANGARIVATVLNNPSLCSEWKEHVKIMADRILLMRKMLYQNLRALGTPGTWDHIISQTGMFSYLGINERQVDALIQNYHIYLLKVGRINMCGLTTSNVEYVAGALDHVVRNVPADPKL